ncbi:Transposase, putative, helix-turn-helix domain [Phytophthora cactorum]|nr:Transposase, putative, helix-turn-helix domain [Phytophthora cactorum]
MVCREQIGRIVVTFKDRLLRFGYELFEKMCKEHNVQIVVYGDEQRSEQESQDLETQELQEDLLFIERKQESCDDSDGSKHEKKVTPNSVMKIKLYPTPEQKVWLKKMFGTHRAIYNKLVEISKDDSYKFSKKDLAEKYTGYLPDYHLKVPEEVMNETYRDFIKALDSSLALYKSLKERDEKTSFPRLTFKSRKGNTTSVAIQARSVSSPVAELFRILPTYFGFKRDEGIKVREAIPEMNYSIRLQMTREAKFYVCIPRIPVSESLSPSTIQRCLSIDRLQPKLASDHRKRHRYQLKKLIYHMYQRIKCMIKDMHQKCSKWLSVNYDEVLLPKFATSEMTQTQKRISSKTSRAMLTWSHYKFKVMLANKMGRTGGRMIECTEPYTSKTCSRCGRINYTIMKQKMFQCPIATTFSIET